MKKLLFLLTAVFCLPMLAGCGGGEEEGIGDETDASAVDADYWDKVNKRKADRADK